MKLSQFLLPVLKENPSDAELVSHRLMLRAGMIRQVAAGVYTWLPLGWRVLQKVAAVVREEMNRAGALEMMMPMVQPADLWQDSGRWEQYGPELLRFTDRHQHDCCLGPTHEEVVTHLMRNVLSSYKQLPMTVYQIQTKFRDEIRPRYGVMRSREFLMKDAYSFHLTPESLQETYQSMHNAYTAIFSRLQLQYRAVAADSGSIGGPESQEFQVIAESGEDCIVYSDHSDYAANIERAQSLAPTSDDSVALLPIEKITTPDVSTIDSLVDYLQVEPQQTIKTLLVKGSDQPVVAVVLRGDHEMNETKLSHIDSIATPLTLLTDEEALSAISTAIGFVGPIDLGIPMIVDRDAAVLANFICGANDQDHHFKNVNWGRDVALGDVMDVRNVVEGDCSPDGQGHLQFARGIEVGHIFQLGDKYSQAMSATVLDDKGKSQPMLMGCYGIGVSRIVAAAIEQYHDDRGIIWPMAMAPFQVVLVPVQMHKSYRVRECIEGLYDRLQAMGLEVLLDDRKERPGVMFATADLIGIPHRIVVSERGIDQREVEYKARCEKDPVMWSLDTIEASIKEALQA